MNFPEELKYTSEHEWIRVEGEVAYIGITEHAQNQLGDIVFVDIPTVGEELNAGDVFGTIEVVKTISDLFMPVSGTILEQNEALEDKPELVNQDPYGAGWLIKIEPSADADFSVLLDAKEYKKTINEETNRMTPIVSIIMGSTSDLPVMEKAAQLLNDLHVPFEMNALSAHRTPEAVEEFAKNAHLRGIKVIIAAAGMAAHLPGVIAASTPLPVIGVPIKSSLDGMDALLAIVQMPPGIPVATVGINGALNAAILAVQMLSLENKELEAKFIAYKEGLKRKIVKANEELKEVKFEFKTN